MSAAARLAHVWAAAHMARVPERDLSITGVRKSVGISPPSSRGKDLRVAVEKDEILIRGQQRALWLLPERLVRWLLGLGLGLGMCWDTAYEYMGGYA